MSSRETDTRDHPSEHDAFRAEVKRSRTANAKKQAAEMARIFGPDRINPPDPTDPNNPFRKDHSLPLPPGAPGSATRRINDALNDE